MSLRMMVLVAVACASIPFAAACDRGKSVTIPPDARDSDATYTLLYSTLGYESAGTKRAYIRQNDVQAPVAQGQQFVWRLVGSNGHEAAAGRAAYGGTAWGIPLWTIDFSKAHGSGSYRLVVEAPNVRLASTQFSIDAFELWRRTFAALALDESEGRAAPIELDNGYYDGNNRTGSAVAHADYAYGLLDAYETRAPSLSEDQRQRLRAAIDRAIDYLILIGDPGTGQVPAEANSRPFNHIDPQATASAARALAHFAVVMKSEDPSRAERAFRRAGQADQWLRAEALLAYPSWIRADTNFDLYRYALDETALARATAAVRELAASYDLRTMDRNSHDPSPHFAAMYRMWRELPSNVDHQLWADTAAKVGEQYHQALGRSLFQVIPPGTSEAARGTDAATQWDTMETDPPPGDNGDDASVANGWFLGRAMDASYLAEMTGDRELEKVAAASLEWVLGLNPGVPSERVLGSSTQSPVSSASFLTGVGAREAHGASSWEWLRTRPFGTIVNGFRTDFTYEDSFAAGDSSLRYDGAWVAATLAYENYVERGKRAPAATSPVYPEAGATVASVEPAASPQLLQAVVSISGPDGKPLPGALVAGAWSGALLPDHTPDEAVQVEECTTAGSGSCVLVLDPASLPVARPITLSVTNVQHPVDTYVPPNDASAVTTSFP